MDDYRLILTIGGVIASLATAWGVAKNQLKAIISDVGRLEESVKVESDRSDSILTRLTVVDCFFDFGSLTYRHRRCGKVFA